MMRVLGDKVLVALPPLEHEREASTGYDFRTTKTSETGLILAQRADSYSEEAQTRGIVMQLGEKLRVIDLDAALVRFEDETLNVTRPITWEALAIREALETLASSARFDVQVGDCVLFAPTAGNPFTHEGVHYLILAEEDILAVLEPQKADAA